MMKKFKNTLYFLIISLIFNIILFSIKDNSITINAYTESKGECVMEVLSGRVLYKNNENIKLPLASTTKILTAIAVIENCDINKQFTIPECAVGIEGSSIYLRKGENLTIKELLYGLMLRSGNDCAVSLACAVSGNIENFCWLMNETAKKIGAKNSNFLNPHGLPQDNHYTTAYDLAKISCYAMKNEIFREIVSTKKITISNEGYDYDRLLINKNKMLSNYKGCTGIKTGYTKEAGRCLVSSALIGDMEVVCVVLDSPDMWQRSTELLNFAFDNYEIKEIFNSENYINNIYENKKGQKIKFITNDIFVYPVLKNDNDKIIISFNDRMFDNFIENPSENVDLRIYNSNQLIFSKKIYTIIDV